MDYHQEGQGSVGYQRVLEETIQNFADIVRTHYFDYYPHVADTEANEKFMRIIDQTSILDKIKKIHPSD